MRAGTGFAAAVLLVMLCEQTFLNAGPLLVKATADAGGAALAGFAFNVLLIARAPLQLFQAVQTSILPHLTRARAGGERDPFSRSVNVTLRAIAGFAGIVALVMLVAGPTAHGRPLRRQLPLRPRRARARLARHGPLPVRRDAQPGAAGAREGRAIRHLLGGLRGHFVLFLLLADFDDRVLQVEVAFVGAAALLAGSLYALYSRA